MSSSSSSSYLALYRKWRPRTFADVIGQEHITKVLCSEVEHGSVSHAYLFCGSRGTGKTTCARILAKAVNCLSPVGGDPCGKCEKCLAFDNTYDVLELDAASNNGVGDIRDLCEKVNFLPIEMKKRVYIIDEVHVLSGTAFNALLKTLEEPPEHVLFILATTELGKIPATILSRCKRFDFHRIAAEAMLPRLKTIAAEEHIGITDDALRLIAYLSAGAMRDALSMLELFVGKQDITRDAAANALGVVGNAPVLSLLRAVAAGDSAAALMQIADVYRASKDMSVLCSELGEMFRDLLIVKYASSSVSQLIDAEEAVINTLREVETAFSRERLFDALDVLEDAQRKFTHTGLSARTVMEMAVLKLTEPVKSTSAATVTQSAPAVVQSAPADEVPPIGDAVPPPEEAPAITEPPAKKREKAKPARTAPSDAASPAAAGKVDAGDAVEMMAFGELLDALKEKDAALYSLFVDGHALVHPDDTVEFFVNPIGYFMLSGDEPKKQLITSLTSRLLGMPVTVTFSRTETRQKEDRPDLSEF